MIDTPMDFGTICKHLQNGNKYMSSEDVLKDVQCIWKNCYKYYDKGNYILDLMKRVEENFMKYWTAAGLFTEERGTTQGEDFIVCFFFISSFICLQFGVIIKKINNACGYNLI